MGILRIFGALTCLALSVLTTIVAVVQFVPEAGDYHVASVRKHERLATLASPKIVLVGGSNLAFGMDSPMIEQVTGRGVVNMGMDGYLGIGFMLAEVEPNLYSTDLVVIALEYDSFATSVAGNAPNQLAITKANSKLRVHLTNEQCWAILQSFPRVAQAKINGRILGLARWVTDKVGMYRMSAWQMAEEVGTLSGFNLQGDLTSHLDVDFPEAPSQGINLNHFPVRPESIQALLDFNQRMREKGVDVLFSYTPTTEGYYEEFRKEIDQIHTTLRADPSVRAPSPPSEFAFPEAWFFDTVYHLKRHGTSVRTQQLVQDIVALIQPAR